MEPPDKGDILRRIRDLSVEAEDYYNELAECFGQAVNMVDRAMKLVPDEAKDSPEGREVIGDMVTAKEHWKHFVNRNGCH